MPHSPQREMCVAIVWLHCIRELWPDENTANLHTEHIHLSANHITPTGITTENHLATRRMSHLWTVCGGLRHAIQIGPPQS